MEAKRHNLRPRFRPEPVKKFTTTKKVKAETMEDKEEASGSSTSQILGMTTGQFRELLQAVGNGRKKISLSECPARYNGARSSIAVEAFLAGVSTFKNVEGLADKSVFEGLPLILQDDAAVWWQGVKHEVKTWDEFENRLRYTYAPKKPAYQVFQEIIEIKQDDNTPTEIFIQGKRALIAQLPPPRLTEAHELDMVFGQIRFEIRDRISRESVTSFKDLSEKTRQIERSLGEKSSKKDRKDNVHNIKRTRCSYCRAPGHTADVCRKLKRSSNVVSENPERSMMPTSSLDLAKPKYKCYGCGEPGVVRSRCQKCNVQKVKLEEISFCSNSTCDKRLRPTVPISIGSIQVIGYIDTCAKSSVASYRLYKSLLTEGYQFKEERMYITFADGISKMQNVLTISVPVFVYGRTVPTSFIVLPEAKDNKTLLGVDFIQDALMIINLPQLTCRFVDDPANAYDLNQEGIAETIIAEVVSEVEIPELLSPMQATPEKNMIPEHYSSVTEMSLKRPYGPTFSYGLTISPKSIVRQQPEPRLADEAPSTLTQGMNTSQQPPMENFANYGPLIPIELRTPPHKRQRQTQLDGYSPIIDELYRDAMRAVEETVVTLSPVSKNLFGSPSTDIASIDVHNRALSHEENQRLDMFLRQHEDVFIPNGKPTTQTEHIIDTGSHRPISVPPYRLPPAKTQILKEEINKMLEERIIKPCMSPWSAPVVMVPKKDGGTRVCIDYRQLNSITTPDVYPLPRIDDLLHNAKRTPFMSTIDLRAGYWQIKVKEEDQIKTAFVTPFGMYMFHRMPFGLRNAPATFQRLMDGFRISLSHIKLLTYLDDLIIMSTSFEDHLKDLQDVFARLKEYNLIANKDKCEFCCAKIKYLGHYITPHGLELDPEKINSIANMPAPSNLKHLLSFIQMCSWYRRFVPNFAKVAEPLTRLTKKNMPWTWDTEQQSAFETLRNLLVTAPVLAQADDTKPYVIKTDASNYAIGAVLVQGEGEMEHPVEYASRLLNQAERNYSTTEREALAVVWAVNKFRGYIEGTPITIMTDHQALKWLMTLKSPTGRLARWALQLQPFDITIKYISGRTNVVADLLSRPFCDAETKEGCGICSIVVDLPKRSSKDIREQQIKDKDIEKIITALEGNSEEDAKYWSYKGYLVNNGLLYRYNPESDAEDGQLVVPQHEQSDVISVYHDQPIAGHYGAEKTYDRISKRYFWKGMRKDIERYVRNCISCTRYKPSNMKPAGLLQTTAMNKRFEVIAFDLFGPLPTSSDGKSWILVIEDLASRWVELFSLETASAENCAMTLINEIFLRYGMPRRMISDNGTQFVSAVMQQVTYVLNIKHAFTPVYHPETNPVERKNRDLKTQLAILVGDNHRAWAEKLPSIRFAMNTATCSSTDHTPAYLTFGRELRTPDDNARDLREIILSENFIPEITPKLLKLAETLKRVREVHEMKEEKRKEYVDKHRRPGPNYKPGDRVMVETHAISKTAQGFSSKLAPRRDGPYEILSSHGPSSFHIADPSRPDRSIGLYHASALQSYQRDNEAPLPTPAMPIRKRGRPPKKTVQEPSRTSRPRGRPPRQPSNLASSPRRLRSQRGRL